MQQLKVLFDEGKFAECLEKCEAELKFASTADVKYQLNVLGSRAALDAGDSAKALAMAEMALKLDNAKMPGYQAMADVCAKTKDFRRLGDTLTQQMLIAKKNGAQERALGFAKEAAVAYESVADWTKAASRWRDIQDFTKDSREIIDSLTRLSLCLDKAGDIKESEECLWRIVENLKPTESGASDMADQISIRLLSRPAHAILESRRIRGQMDPNERPVALRELAIREKRLGKVFGYAGTALVPCLLLAIRIYLGDISNSQEECEYALRIAGVSPNPDAANVRDWDAVRAVAYLALARRALEDEDPLTCLNLVNAAEKLEQSTYARMNQLRQAEKPSETPGVKNLVLEHNQPQMRPFLGVEILGLLCNGGPYPHLLAAKARLASFPEGVYASLKAIERSIREGFTQLEKYGDTVRDDDVRAQLDICLVLCEWAADLVSCSKGFKPKAVELDHIGTTSPLVDAFKQLRACNIWVARQTLMDLTTDLSNEFHVRRLAAAALLEIQVIAQDLAVRGEPIPSEWLSLEMQSFPLPRISQVRSLQQIPSGWKDGFQSIHGLWTIRSALVNGRSLTEEQQTELQKLAQDETDIIPLACEMLGKLCLGVTPLSFLILPENHSAKKLPPQQAELGLQMLSKAVKFDPLGLGAAVSLANVYHHLKAENEAINVYNEVIKNGLVPSPRQHPLYSFVSNYVWTRLGQAQLHSGDILGAQTSFQRALTSLGRPENSTNITAWTGLAESHLRISKLNAAAQAFEKSLSLIETENQSAIKPDLRCACLLKLAKLRNQLGEYDIGSDALRQAIAMKGQCDDALISVAEMELTETLLAQSRRYKALGALTSMRRCLSEALMHLNEQLGRNKVLNQGAAYKVRGEIECELGTTADKSISFRKALWAEPWSALARYDLARVLRLSSQPREIDLALSLCEGALRLAPLDTVDWTLHGLVVNPNDTLIKQHSLVRATQLMAEYSPVPWLNLGWLFERNDKDMLAKRAFSRAQTIDADSSNAWLGHATIALKEKKDNYVAALECAVEAAGNEPSRSSLRAMNQLVRTVSAELAKLGLSDSVKRSKAMLLLDVTTRAMQMDGLIRQDEMAKMLNVQGIALTILARPSQAVKCFERSAEEYMSLKDTENLDSVLLNLAISLSDPMEGLGVAQASAKRTESLSSSARYWRLIGELYLRSGNGEKACISFEKAKSLVNPTAEPSLAISIGNGYCKALMAQGQVDNAILIGIDACELAILLETEAEKIDAFHPLAKLAGEVRSHIQANFMEHPSIPEPSTSLDTLKRAVSIFVSPSANSSLLTLHTLHAFPWDTGNWIQAAKEIPNASSGALRMVASNPPYDCEDIELMRLSKDEFAATYSDESLDEYWLVKTRNKMDHMCPWKRAAALAKVSS